MYWHPLDDKGFRDRLTELDYDPDFAYGLYDAQWAELYQEYEDTYTDNL